MKLSKNTILTTGGTSGIGFELASQLIALDNVVIVTGRDEQKLNETKRKLPQVYTVKSDGSDPDAISALHAHVIQNFPDLNILINNAGIMRKINLQLNSDDLSSLNEEIRII